MQVEEVIKIYGFLGNLDVIGFIALCILLSIGILAVFVPLKEKNIISSKFTWVVVCFINVALIMLYIQAQIKIVDLHRANFIKQDFITSNYKQKLLKFISLPEEYDTLKKIKILKNLVDKFPDEFLLVKLYVKKGTAMLKSNNTVDKKTDDKNELDSTAIALIDAKAIEKIDKQIVEKATRTAHLLAIYIQANPNDSIPVNFDIKDKSRPSLQLIDNEGYLIGKEFFTTLEGRSSLQPIYDKCFNIVAFKIPKSAKIAQVTGGSNITKHE